MKKVNVKFLKSLYPYKKGTVAEIKEEVFERFAQKGYMELVKTEKKEDKKVEQKFNKSMEKKKKKNKAL